MTRLTSIFSDKIDKIGKELVEREKLRKSIEKQIFRRLIYQLSFIFVILLPIVLTFTEIVDVDDILDQLIISLNYVMKKSTSFVTEYAIPQIFIKMKGMILYITSIEMPKITLPTITIPSFNFPEIGVNNISLGFKNIYAEGAEFVYKTIDSSILEPYNRFLLIISKLFSIIKIIVIISPFVLAIISLLYFVYKKRKLRKEKIINLYNICLIHLKEKEGKFVALDHLKTHLKETDGKIWQQVIKLMENDTRIRITPVQIQGEVMVSAKYFSTI